MSAMTEERRLMASGELRGGSNFGKGQMVLIVAKVFALSTPTLTLPLPGGGNWIDRKNLCND